jgi:hypothetical protein
VAAAADTPFAAATSAAVSRPAAARSVSVGLRLDISCGIVVRGRGYHTAPDGSPPTSARMRSMTLVRNASIELQPSRI